MKPSGVLLVFATLLLAVPATAETTSWELEPGVQFVAASVEQGQQALGTRDAFIAQLGPFDRQVRLLTAEPVSEQAYLDHMAAQVQAWRGENLTKLGAAIEAIRPKLQAWNLPWPPQVLFVLTTGKDEPGASGYCRGNAVVLPEKSLRTSPARLQGLLIHELFHVLSNQNADWRRKLYAVVGFRPCNAIELPPSLHARRLTNPDAPRMDYRTEVIAGDERVSIVPILYSSAEKYDAQRGGNLFSYLVFRLLVIEEQNERWRPRLVDGEPMLLEAGDTPSYFDQIGRNTGYIIHPEEVLAENFVLLVEGKHDVKTPRILKELTALLAKPKATTSE